MTVISLMGPETNPKCEVEGEAESSERLIRLGAVHAEEHDEAIHGHQRDPRVQPYPGISISMGRGSVE